MQLIKDYGKAIRLIREELEEYISSFGIKSLVLGLSGGIDSALCAALASPVCEKMSVKLIGRSIHIETNKPEEDQRGRMIGEAYADDYKHVDLTESYKQLLPCVVEDINGENTDERAFKIRAGNIKARLRMIYLYEQASKNAGLVLSTDNWTEQLLGFWTLHGDVGDYGMIAELWKTEVYEMADYIIREEGTELQKEALSACRNAVPTDGLGITSSDIEQLEASSYEEVDKILFAYVYENNSTYETHPVVRRYLRSAYKRTNPKNLKRNIYF